MRNDTHPGPVPVIGGRFHDHYDILKTLAVPLFIHVLAWATLLIVEYAMAAWDFYLLGGYESQTYTSISTEESPATSTATIPAVETTPLLGKSPETGLAITDRRAERISRAGTVARTTFLMLLSVFVMMAVPVEFACKKEVKLPDPLPDPSACLSCMANGAQYPTLYMAWSFFGISVIWILIELVSSSDMANSGASIARLILGAADVGLVAAIYAMTIGRWNYYKDLGDQYLHGHL